MPRWKLILLIAAAVLCAGIGLTLTGVFAPAAAAFGWTAYSPLSSTVYSGSYTPINTTWLVWAPRVGAAMLTIGAGTAGAAITALVLRPRSRTIP